MKQILNNILNSFNNGNKGYSSKKLTAFVVTLLVVIIHIKWLTLGNFSQLEMVLTIDYSFIAALFGMNTYQSLKTKQEKDNSNTEDSIIEPPQDEDKKK